MRLCPSFPPRCSPQLAYRNREKPADRCPPCVGSVPRLELGLDWRGEERRGREGKGRGRGKASQRRADGSGNSAPNQSAEGAERRPDSIHMLMNICGQGAERGERGGGHGPGRSLRLLRRKSEALVVLLSVPSRLNQQAPACPD